MSCHCGELLTEADTESLVEPVFAHFDQAHPELALSRVSVRNYLDAEDRATGGVEAVEALGRVETVAITPEHADEVIAFFDHDAFPDNPAWGSCYCMFYFLGGLANPEWGHVPWQVIREAQRERIGSGRTTGALAYHDGRLVAWCNATARAEFPGRATGEDDGVCSVICFVIAPPYRRRGIATRLLARVVEEAPARGFTAIEAYPRKDAASAASAYVGPLDMYLRAGFRVTSEDPLVAWLDLVEPVG
jgi:GNAT superfamily N-acetyltransferase